VDADSPDLKPPAIAGTAHARHRGPRRPAGPGATLHPGVRRLRRHQSEHGRAVIEDLKRSGYRPLRPPRKRPPLVHFGVPTAIGHSGGDSEREIIRGSH
jgi:hypothetical protein